MYDNLYFLFSAKDVAMRETLSGSLQCKSLNHRRRASAFAGRLRPPCMALSATPTQEKDSSKVK